MNMPIRLSEISETERKDHYYLQESNKNCYYWGEYTPYEHTNGKKWNYSETNQLISNFKKKPNQGGLIYKSQSIDKIAYFFANYWDWGVLHNQHKVSLIPIPPSKARTDPMYDSRMVDVLKKIAYYKNISLDIRDCLSFSGINPASHETTSRPSPEDLMSALVFDEVAGRHHQVPGVIFLFDDVLTTGAHYIATLGKLHSIFPQTPVVGNFVARRIYPNPFGDVVIDL